MRLLINRSTIEGRVFGLDLLRALAILCVLLAHTLRLVGNNSIIKIASIYGAVIGVEIFFVLSGFLIGTILIKVHYEENFTRFESIKIFWIRRWFRTLPNYYLMLIIYTLLYFIQTKTFIFSNIKNILYIFFLQNLTPAYPHLPFFDVSWSLSVEEWFYVLFPLCLFLIQYISSSKYSSLIITLTIFILGFLLLRIYISENFNWPWDEGFRKVLLLRLDSISIGVFAAFCKFYYPKIWNKRKNILAYISLTLLILLLIELKFDFIENYNIDANMPSGQVSRFLETFFFSFISFTLALALPFFSTLEWKNTIGKGVIITISLISYSLYLLHPIVIVIMDYIFHTHPLLNFFMIWIVSLVGSYIQYNIFEKRVTAVRDRFSGKNISKI
ncbi:acyltransferase [Spirosoma horti]